MRNVLNRKIRGEERKEEVKRWKDLIKTFDLVNYIDFYDLESERRKMIDHTILLISGVVFFLCLYVNSRVRKENLLQIFRDQEFAFPGYIAQSESKDKKKGKRIRIR